MRLFRGLERNEEDLEHYAQVAVDKYNSHCTALLLEAQDGGFHCAGEHFWDCLLIWDTGASYGLTTFRGDFIDYEKCKIPVQDISKTNTVIGMGTMMWKFKASNGKFIYLPLL